MKNKLKIIFAIASLVFAFPSIVALLHPGFFQSDDGSWMIIRFASFYEALRYGQFPVRFLFSLNNGYGYPVADFLYPLFEYLAVPVHVVGFGFVASIKIILILSLLGSSVFTFFWLRHKFGNMESFLGSLCYTFFPYHLWDVYKRGSVGEVLALAVVPFVLWQFERRSLFWLSVGIACLILAHNTLAALFLPVIFVYMLINLKGNYKEKFFKALIPTFIGIMLSLFFSLPALYDKHFTVFSSTVVANSLRYFITWSNISLLGMALPLVSLFSVIFLFAKNKNKNFIFFLSVTFLGLFLALPLSWFLWNKGLLVSFVQFPFRFASILVVSSAYLTAFCLNQINSANLRAAVFFFGFLLIFLPSLGFIAPSSFQNYPDSFYATNQSTTTVANEYMPKWVKDTPISPASSKALIIKGKGTINSLTDTGNGLNFTADIKKSSVVRINIIYFPGMIITLDGRKTPIFYHDYPGVMQIKVLPGSHFIKAFFTETPIRLLSDLASLLAFISIIVLSVIKLKVLE